MIGDLSKLVAKLRWPQNQSLVTTPPSETEDELQSLCASCTEIAQEMIERLQSHDFTHRQYKLEWNHKRKLNTRKSVARVWTSLAMALKSAWVKDEKAALMRRLSVIRDAIEMRILVQLR
jgi:hypothetical protein